MIADTIVAIATPVGEGGVGVLRVSGPEAVEKASLYFQAADSLGLASQPPRFLQFGRWCEPGSGKLLDEVLCVRFQAPHSFTGEDVVEVHAHGGTYHLQQMLASLLGAGLRLARPGEFTQRAFINGKMDLTRAEAVADLIHSGTELARASAARQLAGALQERIEDMRRQLIDLSAQVEAAVDFPDEEDQLLPKAALLTKVSALKALMQQLLDTAREGRMVTQGVRVALAGSPNVGKSSLMNALLGAERSIVTAQAGTTRDYIEEKLSIQGFPVLLNDTAGLRDAVDEAEQEGVKRSRSRVIGADVVLLILDVSRPLSASDLDARALAKGDVLIVLHKADLDPVWDITGLARALDHADLRDLSTRVISVSSKIQQGLDQLKTRIIDTALKGRAAKLLNSVALTTARHEDAMRRACDAISHVEATLNEGHLSAEFLSGDLRISLDALGEIVGATSRDDVLKAIFEKFCIGK